YDSAAARPEAAGASRGRARTLSHASPRVRHRPVTRRKILAVVLWMSGAVLPFSATAVPVRALAPSFTVFEILAMRNAAGLAILTAIAALKPALRRELRPR